MQTNCFHCGRDDAPHPRPQPKFDVPITAAEVKKIFSDCDDFEMRTVRIGLESRLDGVRLLARRRGRGGRRVGGHPPPAHRGRAAGRRYRLA
ncbi:MAG: hypothetical protein ACLUNO_08835 [Oscillospiraceae bacterium]